MQQLSRTVKDEQGEVAALANLAEVYRALRQPEQALQLFGQALTLARQTADSDFESAVLNNMGRLYRTLGQTEQARQTQQKIGKQLLSSFDSP